MKEYAAWNWLQVRDLAGSHGDPARTHRPLLEFTSTVLAGAVEALPVPVRTFDTLHLGIVRIPAGSRSDGCASLLRPSNDGVYGFTA